MGHTINNEAKKTSMRILIVDDDETSLEMMVNALNYPDCEIITVANGAEAWEHISKEDIQLVISDWLMPELDGIELCRRIRNSDFPHYVYFILVTARDSVDDVVRGLAAGADEFIRKPVEPLELNARVRSMQRLMVLHQKNDVQAREIEGLREDLRIALDPAKVPGSAKVQGGGI